MRALCSELVGQSAAEDFGGEIVSDLSAKRASSQNPGIRHGPHRCRDILAALLAADGEIALPVFRKVKHEGSIGEQKAKLQID